MMEYKEPRVGEHIKVFLPGESPWTVCVAVYPDGSWDGRIDNKLINQMSSEEQKTAFGSDVFARTGRLSCPHQFWDGDIVNFAWSLLNEDRPSDGGVWQPTSDRPRSPMLSNAAQNASPDTPAS